MSYAPVNRLGANSGGWTDSVSAAVQDGFETARDTVARNPSIAVFIAFGAGLGAGIGLALAFGGPPPLDPGLREKVARFVAEHGPWKRS